PVCRSSPFPTRLSSDLQRCERWLHRQLLGRRQQMRDTFNEREGDYFRSRDDAKAVAAAGQEARRRQAARLRQFVDGAIASRLGRSEEHTSELQSQANLV